MELARNAIYGLHLKCGEGSTYAHLFHVNERGQIDIAMFVDQRVKKGGEGDCDTFRPDLVEHNHNYSHDHWLINRDVSDFVMVNSHVTDTSKITASQYKRMARKVMKLEAQ
ncbi:hypothetical protein PQ125_002649 [Salmonella enterica]|nr:hypothetical protein [Salmonella enterica]